MSQSDPIMFAAKAAALSDAELSTAWKITMAEDESPEWRQALQDELTLRQYSRRARSN